MKKAIFFVVVSAFVGFLAMGSNAVADDVVPGAYGQSDASVMGVGQTVMQFGASARTLTNAVNLASGAGSSRANSNTGNSGGDFQFGSSQTEQSWKQWRSVADAGVVVGLVPGDCRGDNSDDVYRRQMNQNRKGYMAEPLVSQSQCDGYHPTIK